MAAPSITQVSAAAGQVGAEQVAALPHKWVLAASVMGAFPAVLDSSIVNVALPYMQGSFAASVDEVTWIVTSYLVATGIMIPLTGWIAARLGWCSISRYSMRSEPTSYYPIYLAALLPFHEPDGRDPKARSRHGVSNDPGAIMAPSLQRRLQAVGNNCALLCAVVHAAPTARRQKRSLDGMVRGTNCACPVWRTDRQQESSRSDAGQHLSRCG
jgi:hypothetical protein